jgi:hypothetical protein
MNLIGNYLKIKISIKYCFTDNDLLTMLSPKLISTTKESEFKEDQTLSMKRRS